MRFKREKNVVIFQFRRRFVYCSEFKEGRKSLFLLRATTHALHI